MVYAKLEKFPPRQKCNFCHTNQVDEIDLGEIASTGKICVHYFCLLLSSNIAQRGSDKNGILGFMPRDIRIELSRGKKLLCSYCGRSNASIKCSFKKCNSIFHLPCGIRKGSLHQFFGDFHSFCRKHRPQENIPKCVKKNATACALCLDEFDKKDQVFWPSCCRPPDSLFHRKCLQKMAIVSGLYSMKCPLCNDSTNFIDSVKHFGVFIPERDPTWERDGTFNYLLDRRVPCEEDRNCRCSKGPNFNRARTQWMIHRCQLCGGSGIHLACSNLWQPGSKYTINWTCKSCKPTSSHDRRALSSSEDMLVDVEAVDSEPESFIKMEEGHSSLNHQVKCEAPSNSQIGNPVEIIDSEDDDTPATGKLEITRLRQHTALPSQSSDCPESDTIIVSDSDDDLSVCEILVSSASSEILLPESNLDGNLYLQRVNRKIPEVVYIID